MLAPLLPLGALVRSVFRLSTVVNDDDSVANLIAFTNSSAIIPFTPRAGAINTSRWSV
jgi:hypothetical protein